MNVALVPECRVSRAARKATDGGMCALDRTAYHRRRDEMSRHVPIRLYHLCSRSPQEFETRPSLTSALSSRTLPPDRRRGD